MPWKRSPKPELCCAAIRSCTTVRPGRRSLQGDAFTLSDRTIVTAGGAGDTLLDRLRKRAEADPDRTALVSNGEPVSYARFLRSIDLHRLYFASHRLPVGGTVIVLIDDLALCW